MNGTRVLGGQRGTPSRFQGTCKAKTLVALFASSAILSKLLDLCRLQLFIYKMEIIRDAHFLGLL